VRFRCHSKLQSTLTPVGRTHTHYSLLLRIKTTLQSEGDSAVDLT
jgi:hypothetical protein